MENPYTIDNNEQLMDSFVCLADILGFTHLCEEFSNEEEGNERLAKIKESIQNAFEFIDPSIYNFQNICEYSVKVFTDNIAIGYPLSKPLVDFGEHELGRLLDGFSAYQFSLAIDGYFLRGAISYGKHYMDDLIVFGDALIDAHKIDVKGAPPRIVISPRMYEKIRDHLHFYSPPSRAPYCDVLLKDSDGSIFLNYLHMVTIANSEYHIEIDALRDHKTRIIENLHSHSHEPSILSKYEWLANYHNYFCNELADKYAQQIDYYGDPENPYESSPENSIVEKLIQDLWELKIEVPLHEIMRIDISDFENSTDQG